MLRLSKKMLGCEHRQDIAGLEKLRGLLSHMSEVTGVEMEES